MPLIPKNKKESIYSTCLGQLCLVKWKENGEDLFVFLHCTGFEIVDLESEDYYINFVHWPKMFKISQIARIFVSQITENPVLILKDVISTK